MYTQRVVQDANVAIPLLRSTVPHTIQCRATRKHIQGKAFSSCSVSVCLFSEAVSCTVSINDGRKANQSDVQREIQQQWNKVPMSSFYMHQSPIGCSVFTAYVPRQMCAVCLPMHTPPTHCARAESPSVHTPADWSFFGAEVCLVSWCALARGHTIVEWKSAKV